MIRAVLNIGKPVTPSPDEIVLTMDKTIAVALMHLTGDITGSDLEDQTVLEPMHDIFWELHKIIPEDNSCDPVFKPR